MCLGDVGATLADIAFASLRSRSCVQYRSMYVDFFFRQQELAAAYCEEESLQQELEAAYWEETNFQQNELRAAYFLGQTRARELQLHIAQLCSHNVAQDRLQQKELEVAYSWPDEGPRAFHCAALQTSSRQVAGCKRSS